MVRLVQLGQEASDALHRGEAGSGDLKVVREEAVNLRREYLEAITATRSRVPVEEEGPLPLFVELVCKANVRVRELFGLHRRQEYRWIRERLEDMLVLECAAFGSSPAKVAEFALIGQARMATTSPLHCATHRVLMTSWHLLDILVLQDHLLAHGEEDVERKGVVEEEDRHHQQRPQQRRWLPLHADIVHRVRGHMGDMDRAVACARALEVVSEHSYNTPRFHARGTSVQCDILRAALDACLPIEQAMTKIFASRRRRTQGPEARWECVAMAHEVFGVVPNEAVITQLLVESNMCQHRNTIAAIHNYVAQNPQLVTRLVAGKLLAVLPPARAKEWWDSWLTEAEAAAATTTTAEDEQQYNNSSGMGEEEDDDYNEYYEGDEDVFFTYRMYGPQLAHLRWNGFVISEMLCSFMARRRHVLWREFLTEVLHWMDTQGHQDTFPGRMIYTPRQGDRLEHTSRNVVRTLRYWADIDNNPGYRDMADRWERIVQDQLRRYGSSAGGQQQEGNHATTRTHQ